MAELGYLALIGPVAELGHDIGDTVVGGVLYRGSQIPSLQGDYVYGTWSDDNRILGNGTLLVSSPPLGLDLATLPPDASALTPAQNAMWTTRIMSVANNGNGRINGPCPDQPERRPGAHPAGLGRSVADGPGRHPGPHQYDSKLCAGCCTVAGSRQRYARDPPAHDRG